MVGAAHYHTHHFSCSVCSLDLSSDNQRPFIIDNQLVCEAHYKSSLPICQHCNGIIDEDFIEALGQSYHEDHFLCSICELSIEMKEESLEGEDTACFHLISCQIVCNDCAAVSSVQ